MGRDSRKKWLLLLWDYHNGGLREAEIQDVDRRFAEDPKARTDSERVLGIINELRQEGRWETHPEFPSQMVDRILQGERGPGTLRWVILAVIGVLVVIFLLFARGNNAAQGGDSAFAQVRSAFSAIFAKTHESAPVSGFDKRKFDLGGSPAGDLEFESEWIPAASLELEPRGESRLPVYLEDPVSKIEGEMDALFQGGFAPGP